MCDRKFQEFKELEVAQTLVVLAAVDWKGIHETVESYVGLWEVCANENLCMKPCLVAKPDRVVKCILLTVFHTWRE